MPNTPYQNSENQPVNICEPAELYSIAHTEVSSSDEWNPNIPFYGTQEEWWDHFHQIEKGPFYPLSEVHQRVSQWLDNQKK